MKKYLLITACLLAGYSFGQTKALLFLKDKKNSKVVELSERSISRRTNLDIRLNDFDKSVSPTYINELNKSGKVVSTSRWLNAVYYETNLTSEEITAKWSFIERVQEFRKTGTSVIEKFPAEEKQLDYGVALNQTTQINANCLHDLGFNGSGVYLAIIDAGFRNMDDLPMFDTLHIENRVLDAYNFVDNNTVVYDFSGHGRAVGACIVGQNPSQAPYSGTAVDVDVALYVSEDVDSETELEEFNLVAALERCDSVGVDVANISLGYFEFDDSLTSHVYADLDGVTTIAAIGVNIAASKGIAVVASAGNSGPSTISTPCDADSILCVGAVDSLGQYAFFSSVGPSADGQVKPDVMAQGFGAWTVYGNGDLGTANGTSFSSPITAGAVACLRQANPTATVDELFDAIRQSASQFATPDSLMGYGIPDFCAAHGILNNNASVEQNEEDLFSLYPNPSSGSITINCKVSEVQDAFILNGQGQRVVFIQQEQLNKESGIDIRQLSTGLYFVVVNGAAKKLMVQ